MPASPSVDMAVRATDLLIVGTGGAGMRAAIEARERDLDVTLIAKGPWAATHSRMSGGRYNAMSGVNPDDAHDIFFQDTIRGGAGINNQKLVRIMVHEAIDRVYDLEAMGLMWLRASDGNYLLSGSGGGTRLRMLGSLDEGIGLTEVMIHECRRKGVRVVEHQMLIDVIQADDGRVEGALVLDAARGQWVVYDCGAVIVATGGTSQLYETNSGPALNTGDGIAIALRAGAELVDIEFMQFIPISFVFPDSIRGYTLTEPAYYGKRHFDLEEEPAHLTNTQQERFLAKHDPERMEASTRDVIARAIMLEVQEGRGTPEGGVWMHPDPEVFEDFLRERPMYAKRILESYGERAARFQEPFQVMPSALYTTGGVRIDEWCRTGVPGLYTAGEAAGGVHGANRLGANSWPDIQVFGCRAGRAASEEALEYTGRRKPDLSWARSRAAGLEAHLGREGRIRPPQLRKQIEGIVWNQVGLVRSGEGLDHAVEAFRGFRDELLGDLRVNARTRVINREWSNAIELENMLDVAEAMATAALCRTESRGAHYRKDYPSGDDGWLRNVHVRRSDGRMVADKRPLVAVENTGTSAPTTGTKEA